MNKSLDLTERQEALTSLLLLESQFCPVLLHAIPQSHPQLGLLLQRHALPPLLEVRQGRFGDGCRGGAAGGRGQGTAGRPRKGAPQEVG